MSTLKTIYLQHLNGSAANLTLDANGKVAVGSTSPNTSFDVSSAIDGIALATGTTAQRPSSAKPGTVRYNSTLDCGELYTASGGWQSFGIPLGTLANPASSGQQLFNYNPNLSAGLYYFQNSVGTVQQLYCDVPAGGWVLVASNNASDGTIPGGSSKNSLSYTLNRNNTAGALGTASPNSDYLIGNFLDNFIFNETRGFGFGRSSTNGTYSYTNPGTYVEAIYRLTGTGTSRYSLIVPRSSVLTYGNSSIYSGASYFVMDGILADYNTGGFNANSNQSTIGMIGPGSSNADPGSGNYYGHGSTEGNYEGWYDNSGNSADCQGYTTWVR